MKISEEQLRKNFSQKLSDYRKSCGMTQLELAEKLSYSDKSISKWERGDGIPDVFVVSRIADLFGVTVNDMISDKAIKRRLLSRNKLLTTILAMAIPWLAAVILYFIFELLWPGFKTWQFYVYAIPASAIVAIVFTSIWFKKIWQFFSVTALIWTAPTCFVVVLDIPKIPLIYIISAVVQGMTILWFLMKKHEY